MIRRYRSQSLSDPKRSDNANTFKRSGSVQDLKVLGGKKDMLNKKKTKLTRQESVEIRANDEGQCVNLIKSCIRAHVRYYQRFCRISEVAPRVDISLAKVVHPPLPESPRQRRRRHQRSGGLPPILRRGLFCRPKILDGHSVATF